MNKRAHLMHHHPDITLNWEKKKTLQHWTQSLTKLRPNSEQEVAQSHE